MKFNLKGGKKMSSTNLNRLFCSGVTVMNEKVCGVHTINILGKM
jgi:hypothetical protein